MKRILLTGMSGTGKTTMIRALAARGFKTVDTDDGWCEPLSDGRQQWRADAITHSWPPRTRRCCSWQAVRTTQVQLHRQFYHIVLLSAPPDVLAGRLAARTDNPYGKALGELDRVLADLQTVEPLLRQVADHEIYTTLPPDVVVTATLRLAEA